MGGKWCVQRNHVNFLTYLGYVERRDLLIEIWDVTLKALFNLICGLLDNNRILLPTFNNTNVLYVFGELIIHKMNLIYSYHMQLLVSWHTFRIKSIIGLLTCKNIFLPLKLIIYFRRDKFNIVFTLLKRIFLHDTFPGEC